MNRNKSGSSWELNPKKQNKRISNHNINKNKKRAGRAFIMKTKSVISSPSVQTGSSRGIYLFHTKKHIIFQPHTHTYDDPHSP